jgi:integrase
MATVSAVVYQDQKKVDGTYNVKIRVFHRKERRILDTTHFVTERQLGRDYKIKDKQLNKVLDEILDSYREAITLLGPKLDFMHVEELKNYLRDKDKDVDFIAFCGQHIESLKKAKRNGTANNHRAVRNSLIDYFKRESVSIIEINSGMLVNYEKWLRTDRTMKRVNQLNKEVTTIEKGMKDGGVYAHMRDLRTLFNEARRFYNNEDVGIIKIKHYPFIKYKIGASPKTRKRNIQGEQLVKLVKLAVEPGGRAELARDLFLLSFYMCGMNAVDFYNLDDYDPKSVRLEYNRSKTTGIRDDEAFISIKIIPEARPLLEKYVGKLRDRYSTYNGLDTALSKGMKLLRKSTGIPDITFYWARHTFATIARNKCNMDKDDIAEALNHVDGEHKITDIYIEKDWGIVDKVQAAVVKFLTELMKPKPVKPGKLQVKELIDTTEQRKTMRLVSA